MSKTTTLPVELIMEILSNLPAKSLLSSCKLVCKSWLAVVKDPEFIEMHLNRGAIDGGTSSNNNNSSQSLMCRSGKELFQLHLPFNLEDVPPNNSDDVDYTLTITPTKLDFEAFPLNFKYISRLVGSCNGLLCIDRGEYVVLLNPCTRKYKYSPIEPYQYLSDYTYYSMPTSYGFGCVYDSTTAVAEYKVVRIAHSYPSKSEVTSQSDVKVYSMSTNSWRRVTDIPSDILEMITKTTNYQSGLFLNGALHWMSHATSDIVSFDMRSEEFRIMPARPPYNGNRDIKVLMIKRGCLGMIRIRGSWKLEISIMKEYGVSESWTRETVIRLSSSQVGLFGLSFVVCLDDQILLQEMGGRLVLYDMNKKMSVYIDIQIPKLGVLDERFEDDMFPSIESLVSLKSSVLPLSKDKKRRMETLDTVIKE